MPTASMTASAPRPPVRSRTTSPTLPSTCVVEVDRLGAERRDAGEPLGHAVDDDHAEAPRAARSAPPCRRSVRRRGRAACRRRARRRTPPPATRWAARRRGRGTGRRRAVRHLDGQEVGERDAEVLRLPAGHLPVELAVAEEARAGAVLAVLGGLALAVEAAVAHPAGAAADVERDDDPVADLEVVTAGADLLDDAHRLVADDVAGSMNGARVS